MAANGTESVGTARPRNVSQTVFNVKLAQSERIIDKEEILLPIEKREKKGFVFTELSLDTQRYRQTIL